MPHLLQSGVRTFLVFYLSEPESGWDGTNVTLVDPNSASTEPLGIIEWLECAGAVLGGPDDEAYDGHRLWSSGLSDVGPYAAAEVMESQWIADLEIANRVHPQHRPEAFQSFRHFILGFHDSTSECVATGYRTWRRVMPMPEALIALAERLDRRSGHDVLFDEAIAG